MCRRPAEALNRVPYSSPSRSTPAAKDHHQARAPQGMVERDRPRPASLAKEWSCAVWPQWPDHLGAILVQAEGWPSVPSCRLRGGVRPSTWTPSSVMTVSAASSGRMW